jgi:hypothetical protein
MLQESPKTPFIPYHIGQEYSTYDWIMDGLIDRAHFQILSKQIQEGIIVRYLCRKEAIQFRCVISQIKRAGSIQRSELQGMPARRLQVSELRSRVML